MNRGKNRTKDSLITLKIIKIILIILIVTITLLYITCKPAYKVTIAGETIGLVTDKEIITQEINKYLNETDENIAHRELNVFPEYKLQLIQKNIKTDEASVLSTLKGNVSTTYRAYSVNFNGEQKAIIANEEQANNLINELKSDLNDEIELNFDIVEVYSDEFNVSSEDSAKKSLNEVKIEKVSEYEKKKAEELAAKQKAEAEAKAAREKAEAERKTKEAAAITPNTWRLEIPKIGLRGNIAEGTDANVIEHLIGHFPETVADNGNVGLAAHNAGHSANYFSKIKNLGAGDLIYYIHGGVKKTYSVVSKDIISVYDWSKLGATADERITLITCVDGDTEIRLCVQAVRVD